MQKMFALLGYPVAHSLSPVMMNTAFSALAIDAHYAAFAVQPDDLGAALAGLAALGFCGANVTIPHKENVFRQLTEVSAQAQLAKAVNTLVRGGEGGWVGHNTDVAGWWHSFEDRIQPSADSTVCILGAGGAARAVLAGLSLHAPGAQVTVVARRLEQAQRLSEEFGGALRARAEPWSCRHEAAHAAGYIIQSTPMGMWPHSEESCLEDDSCFHAGQVVQDLVYRPLTTRLLTQAAGRGAEVIDGARMLVGQGAAALELWLGQAPPVALMRQTVLERL